MVAYSSIVRGVKRQVEHKVQHRDVPMIFTVALYPSNPARNGGQKIQAKLGS
jgi:hypothetical protein